MKWGQDNHTLISWNKWSLNLHSLVEEFQQLLEIGNLQSYVWSGQKPRLDLCWNISYNYNKHSTLCSAEA